MINKLFLVFIIALCLQSCFVAGLFNQPEQGTTCMHQKTEFCTKFWITYEEDWINRQKFAETRKYFGNFDLFNQVGAALASTFNPIPNGINGKNWKNPELDSLYMYKISWADSFYLYHYRSPHLVERCICDMYDAGYTDSFELERPVWKFYKLNDTTYFSTRWIKADRDSFLHQPQKILWKRTQYSWDYETKQFQPRYQNERKKKKPLIYTYELNRLDMPADLFWQITTQQSPKLSSRKIANFSMDSLIRSFQK